MMARHVIADALTGEIVRIVTCLSEQAAAQAGAGEVLFASEMAEPRTHRMLGNALVPYTVEQATAKATRPEWATRWDNALMAWHDPRTLAELKATKIAELKAAATAAQYANITLQSVTFVADAATQAELVNEALIAQMAIADNLVYGLDWERANGNPITLTASQVKALVRGIRNRTDDIRAQFRVLRAAVVAATTKAEIDAIDWT